LNKNPVQWAEQSREFLNEVQVEFKKVTWPSQKEIVAGTVAVVVVTALLSVALFGVDAVLAWVMSWVLS
jgi:preprotein translocase subunit SecE